jgi:phospholipase C
MKSFISRAAVSLLCWASLSNVAFCQISSFQHIVVVVQENRTPDNLFQGLCTPPYGSPGSCGMGPTNHGYNIQTKNWLDKGVQGGVIQPLTVPLANSYGLGHSHVAFTAQCDLNPATGICAMDGAAKVGCAGTCPSQPEFRYVDNSTGILNPYLSLATQYGWANQMFQTNQGPSFPAHQFVFGGTSAPSAADDADAIFASENVSGGKLAGCIATSGTLVQLITSSGENRNNKIYPCFEHNTLSDLLPPGISWKYYTPGAGSIWTAPNAIQHICQPNQPYGGQCVGSEWIANVDLVPKNVLSDIQNCALANLVWVIPTGQNSDHPGGSKGGGPAWVASVVNAIVQSTCRNRDGSTYWNSTAILITWDDWGGWYDHEAPTILSGAQGDYQYGFRVPLLVVSAYTPAGYISNKQYDFGSILRFVEQNFGIVEGELGFADARAANDLTDFFNLHLAPRPSVPIPSPKTVQDFINDNSRATDPDDD